MEGMVGTDSGKSPRLVSLDALRGANMFFIMGGASLVAALAALWPDSAFWRWIGSQMHHVSWHGVAHHDMIFPTFLFIAGCTFPFSLAKQRAADKSTCAILRKVILRGFLLVVIGLFYNNNVRFDFNQMRFGSVLGHIGLAWMIAALLTMAFGWKTRLGILTVILVGYWLALRNIVAPDAPPGADPYSMEGCLVGYIDRLFLPGTLYEGKFDPEGLFSTLPAIGTALLGVFAGEWICHGGVESDKGKKAFGLLVASLVLIGIGWVWSYDFPLNKKLWTSSFVCFVGGFSTLGLAFFYWVIDVVGWKGWAFFFVVIGMNPITIYLASRLVDLHKPTDFFFGYLVSLAPETYRPLLGAAAYVLLCWGFLYFLYRRKIFFKV